MHKILSIFFTVIILLSITSVKAQINRVPNLPGFDEKFIRFGFILAVNQMHYAIKPENDIFTKSYDEREQLPAWLPITSFKKASLYSVEYRPTLGFAVGIVSNMRINRYFDLRFVPQLSFGSRDLIYDYDVIQTIGDTIPIQDKIKISSTYMDFPLIIKFKSKRIMDYRPYIFGGINPSVDLASQANKTDEENKSPKLYRYDVGGIVGAGCDLYMNWFKFGIEFQMLYGVKDMLKKEDTIYTGGVDYLKSKIFQITLTFE